MAAIANIIPLNLSDEESSGLWINYESWSLLLMYLVYNWVTPVNLLLSLIIVIHNSIIVRFFYLHSRGVTQRLYLLTGIADISAAVGMIVFSISAALFYNGLIGQICFQKGIIFFLIILPAAFACSRSLNVLVTVTKTVYIASIAYRGSPYETRVSALSFLSFFVFLLWLSINTADVIIAWTFGVSMQPSSYRDRGILTILLTSSLVGRETAGHAILSRHELDADAVTRVAMTLDVVTITIHYALPSLIALVCMVIQSRAIRLIIQQDSTGPSASFVNRTIFMVTALFCICHTAYSVYILITLVFTPGYQYIWKRSQSQNRSYLSVIAFFEFSLPLLNAALFPLIIILRKQSLRERYSCSFFRFSSAVRNGFRLVGEKCGGAVTRVRRIFRSANCDEV